jgi:Lysyl oxidase
VRPILLAVALAVAVLAGSGGAAATDDLLPDLNQAAPSDVSILVKGDRTLLTFASATDNVGAGPLVVFGRREGRIMAVSQEIERADGSFRTVPTPAVMRYVRTPTHEHWHLIGFERYELYRAPDHTLVGRSRKAGFCLGDRYRSLGAYDSLEPRWVGNCGKDQPGRRGLRVGISPGFGDDYVPTKEGQYVDVTGLPSGLYELVHVANPSRTLLESDYGNNEASVLVDLPAGEVVATCADSGRCAP